MVDQLGQYLRDNADPLAKQIMADWNRVGQAEPWHRLPQSMDHDHLPDLIEKLSEASLLTFFGEKERTALCWIAVQHGQHRFETGAAEETIGREYELLRWALWAHLKEHGDYGSASEAIVRLDSSISFAHGASLRGYHRRAIEGSDDWPAAVERYMEAWAFPGFGRSPAKEAVTDRTRGR